MRIAFISRNSGYRPLAERLAAKLPAHEVVFRGTSGPLDLEGDKRALKQGSAWAQPQGTALLRGAGEDRGAGGGAARGTARGGGAGRLLAGAGGSPASDPSAPRGFMLRPSVALLLLLLFLVGCGSATRGFRPTTNQHTFHYSGMYGTAPAQGASNGGLSQGIPRAALRFVPQGAMTAAEAGPATTAGNALVAGGAVVVAGSSVVLVCLTVKAALNGMQTPIDIADTFYGTHFGDLQGWFQGCYAPKATVAPGESTPTFDVKPESEPHALPTPRRSPEAHEGGDKKSWGRIYATYTKYNPQTGRYYSGRTSKQDGLERAKNALRKL